MPIFARFRQGLRLLQQPALKSIVKDIIEPANIDPDDIAAIDLWMRQIY